MVGHKNEEGSTHYGTHYDEEEKQCLDHKDILESQQVVSFDILCTYLESSVPELDPKQSLIQRQ